MGICQYRLPKAAVGLVLHHIMKTHFFKFILTSISGFLILIFPALGDFSERAVDLIVQDELPLAPFVNISNAEIAFTVTHVYSIYPESGEDWVVMFSSDNAFWTNLATGEYQEFTEVTYRDSTWGSGRPGGTFFFGWDGHALTTIANSIQEFNFESPELNDIPVFSGRMPSVMVRNHPRRTISPIRHLLFDPATRPLWDRTFTMLDSVSNSNTHPYIDESKRLIVHFDSQTLFPSLLIHRWINDDGDLRVSRTAEFDNYNQVFGVSFPTRIMVTYYNLETGAPRSRSEYFIKKDTIYIGDDVPPIFRKDSLIPIGARVVNEITNETYIHYGSVEGGDAADAVGDYLRDLLDD